MIFSTFKAANGSTAQLGNPQTQPVFDSIAHVIKQATMQTGQNSVSLPAHQASFSTPVIVQQNGTSTVHNNFSISDIVQALSSDSGFILPGYKNRVNQILPSNAIQLAILQVFNNHIRDDISVTTRKFEPYEILTGISHERPEIVMLTNFLPLFNNDGTSSDQQINEYISANGNNAHMTDAGLFVDTQLNVRNLKQINNVNLIRMLSSDNQPIQSILTSRKQVFQQSVNSLTTNTNFLLDLVRNSEHLKSQLDLRNDVHLVSTDAAIRNYMSHVKPSSTFMQGQGGATQVAFLDLVARWLPKSYSMSDVLVRLGYDSNTVKKTFSSSKLWLQMTFELRDILRYHSLEFLDIDLTVQKNDRAPALITRNNAVHFGLRQQLPDLPNVNELINIQPIQALPNVQKISNAWQVIYQNVHFKTPEARIAALTNLISKEFRYSTGLANPTIQRLLQQEYSYAVQTNDNRVVFDSVIGRFGINISDFPAVQTNSLTNVAQQQPATNVAVLTFESKYVDGDTGSLTPGGTFYVDQTLQTDGKQFDTSRLDAAASLFENQYTRLSTFFAGMNIFGARLDSKVSKDYSQFAAILSSPSDYINQLLNPLVVQKTGATLTASRTDNLTGLYATANTNLRVKAALFLYTMTRISRSYSISLPSFTAKSQADNTPATNLLIVELVAELTKAVPQTLAGNSFLANVLTHPISSLQLITGDAIRSSLKSGTYITRYVEAQMLIALSLFRANDLAIVNGHTKYSNYSETIVMMMVFDLLIQMIARYCNQTIVSSNYGQSNINLGTLTFVASRPSATFRDSIDNLKTRLERETALNIQASMTALNTLQKLGGAFKSFSNYLKSSTANTRLNEISTIIGDPNMLSMLMSEQQIMMLASSVYDLKDKLSQTAIINNVGDADEDGDFDADDDMKLLDDAAILPKLRNIFYGALSTDQFSSKKGYNKKILTVGIPIGFTRRLKQKISLGNLKKTSFVNKQSDVIQIVVYKVDIQNNNIIYKPQRFLFELSRFPVRNDRYFLPVSSNPTISDIMRALPTRDFGESFDSSTTVEYTSVRSTDISQDNKVAFSSETYSFLTSDQKAEIIKNHVLSYLFEIYIRLLTGASVADYHFDMVDPPKPMDVEFVKLITQNYVSLVAAQAEAFAAVTAAVKAATQAPVGGVLFSSTAPQSNGFISSNVVTRLGNSSGMPGNVSHASQAQAIQSAPFSTATVSQQSGRYTNVEGNLSQTSAAATAASLFGYRSISALSNTISPLSDPLAVSKRLISPKQFDRVFNIIVDPDDFEIDYDKTVATPDGKQTLQQLILNGYVTNAPIDDQAKKKARGDFSTASAELKAFALGQNAPDINTYKLRDRDRNEGDLTFEKYFVTIETFDEDGV